MNKIKSQIRKVEPFCSIVSIGVALLIFSPYFMTGIAWADKVNLPKTGQITCYATGDDGDSQTGLVWPRPRFTDHGDGTITDNLTGLMWLKDGSCFDFMSWQSVIDTIADFNNDASTYNCADYTATYSDWRLPNINELVSLLKSVAGDHETYLTWLNEQGFTNVRPGYYSSTTNAHKTTTAWMVQLYGIMHSFSKAHGASGWAVRGTSTGPAQVWKTGQKISYKTGDDGDNQAGTAWPSPRFTVDAGGTGAIDQLTGLMWACDASTPSYDSLCEGGEKNWKEALDYVRCLNQENYLGFRDWRLPNRHELHSLTDFSQFNPALPSGHPFTGIAPYLPYPTPVPYYWSSSTHNDASLNTAWAYFHFEGGIQNEFKSILTNRHYVWPVRGGPAAPKPVIVNDLVTFEPIGSSYWSTYDTTGCTEGFVGKFSFDARLTNTSNSSLTDLVVEVAELTNDNLLQNADGVPGGVGSQLTVSMEDDYSGGTLGLGESIIVPFTICLKKFSSFRLVVDVLGTE